MIFSTTDEAQMKKAFLFVSLVFLALHATLQEAKIQQKEGIIQNKNEQHIVFRQFQKFEPDLSKVTIGRITKLIIFENRVYILDGRQSRIFVFDRKANYLCSVGRPGQGPGDLEYPSDFFISNKGIIYVLNSMAKRIEVFSLAGDFAKRIELKLPKEIILSRPQGILVDRNENLFITYNLSPHLIDIYDKNGKFSKTLLKREDQIYVPGENIGNCSQIMFFPEDNAILHFSYLTGVFIKVSLKGKVESKFSVFDALQSKEVARIEEGISGRRKESGSGVQIREFQLWSKFCLDKNNNIYVFLILKKKTENQKIFVFSSQGDFLYWENIPYFADTRIDDLYCFEDSFVFKTSDDDLFFSKSGG